MSLSVVLVIELYNYGRGGGCRASEKARIDGVKVPSSVLPVLVHAADTDVIVSDLEADEAFVTPPSAPRVLDLPVVAVAELVELTAPSSLLVAVIPPLVDIASRRCGIGLGIGLGIRLRIRVRIRVRVGTVPAVANDDNSVVEVLADAAIVALLDDTAGVIREQVVDDDSNVHGLPVDDLHHFVDVAVELGQRVDVADDLVLVVVARTGLGCCVLVVRVFHGAVPDQIVVMVLHPAAFASPAAPVFGVVSTS